MMTITDQLGRTIHLEGPPKRIVSVVPSQTELLADLGLADRVVGITKFCIHPDTWFRSKARVGGTKTLNLDKIRMLQPDLIIANKEENNREQIEELAAEFPVWISDIRTLGEALHMIGSLGNITGTMPEAQKIIEQIQTGFAVLSPSVPTRRALYLIWKEPRMSVNADTFIHDMLCRCGFENVAAGFPERYPVLSDEQIRELDPAVVLLSSEPYPFREKHQAEFKALLPAAKVLLADGETFSWYGSRLLKSAGILKSYIEQLTLP